MQIKRVIQKTIFPIGSDQIILKGFLKGEKIRISENSQWAPLIGNWEPSMQYIFSKMIKKGHVFYDLGANIGLHGIYASMLVGETGHVYNFEPLRSNCLEIETNYQLNNISNYTNIQKAISSNSSKALFSVASHNGQGSLIERVNQVESIEVETISLDDFINNGNRAPNFIKIDIEGSEGECLAGFEVNFDKIKPMMIIELHNPESDLKVGRFLKKYNYAAYRFDTFKKFKLERVLDLEAPYPAKNGIWGSVFCLHNSNDISLLF